MALTAQDKIECKDIAREIVKEVLIEHIANCPHHQSYMLAKSKIFGLLVGVIAASGLGSGAVAAIVVKLFGVF